MTALQVDGLVTPPGYPILIPVNCMGVSFVDSVSVHRTLHFHGLVTVHGCITVGICPALFFQINVEIVIILPCETFKISKHIIKNVILIPIPACNQMEISTTNPNHRVIINQP
nr:MAG TPA: hypothetical protein [Caudoviricetes sp.]